MTRPGEDDTFVSIADTARSARRRRWIIILIPILTVGSALAASFFQQPVFEASSRVVVAPKGGTQDNLSNIVGGLQLLTIEMEAAGLNPSMAEEVVNTVGPSTASEADLNDSLTIAQLEDTRFLTLTYSDTKDRTAQEVANVTAEVFAEKAPQANGVANYAQVNVNALAGVPLAPEDPDPLRNAFGALLIGLMLGIGLAFWLEYQHLRRLHSPDLGDGRQEEG
jgi:capsular polysaccharide biosynthesis protein